MIILGYYGIGKTTLGGKNKFIDLDEFDFLDSAGNLELTKYLNIAAQLSNQGYNVFISTHPDILRIIHLNCQHDSDYCIVFPSLALKQKWLDKLYDRAKNFMSYSAPCVAHYFNALNNYDQDITKISTLLIKQIEIESLEYDLADLLYNI